MQFGRSTILARELCQRGFRNEVVSPVFQGIAVQELSYRVRFRQNLRQILMINALAPVDRKSGD
ncbi:MAG: hypothetical protein VR78_15760 [Hoeflea sp. BRH_c9]|nr:MAG: hypothetical protein VR78_15760 [Hoeflea sp. BRH_c9]